MLTTDTLVGSEASFMSSAHLIMGSEDAVLVDTLFAKSDAQRVVDCKSWRAQPAVPAR